MADGMFAETQPVTDINAVADRRAFDIKTVAEVGESRHFSLLSWFLCLYFDSAIWLMSLKVANRV